ELVVAHAAGGPSLRPQAAREPGRRSGDMWESVTKAFQRQVGERRLPSLFVRPAGSRRGYHETRFAPPPTSGTTAMGHIERDVAVGDFRIERRIGAGGMGVVYKARQVSLDRDVALKVLGSALTRELDKARFQRESQAVAKLNHPGIAAVYFIGQDRQVCYMAF